MNDTTTIAPLATISSFADFGVEPALCESLAAVGITTPFPIQELTLPLALSGADIIGQARTGTGKTLGFGLPLLQRIDTAEGLQALVIVPTRELCLQVSEDLAQAGRVKGIKVVALYGGKAMQPQIDALVAGAQLVVGTPGRLLDLSRRGFLDLSGCKALVLDEADEMLDLGFLPDVEQLVEQCDSERQTLLFSATMPAQIVSLARRYMTKPTFMRADVEEVRIAPQTKQHFFSCHRMDKPAVLARILQTPDRGLCVVFCRTKRMADILAEELRDRDVPAQAIHSDLRQDARERALQKFRDGTTTVLCATEVAARGLDIDRVTHVVNYDCPDDEKMYLHRIGRTGRAGGDGVAITFAVYNEIPRLEMIRRELGIEEEILEVFSTSPLLEELFDLPVREQRSKVASPPPRGGRTSSRSSRDTSDSGREPSGRESTDRESTGRGRGSQRGRDDVATDVPEARAGRGAGGRGGRRADRDAPAALVARPDADVNAAGDAGDRPRRRRSRSRRGDADATPAASDISTVVDSDADETAAGTSNATILPDRDTDRTDDEGAATTRRRRSGAVQTVEGEGVEGEGPATADGGAVTDAAIDAGSDIDPAVEPAADWVQGDVIATRTRTRGRDRGGREGRERTRTVREPAARRAGTERTEPAARADRTDRTEDDGRGTGSRGKGDGRAKGTKGDGRGRSAERGEGRGRGESAQRNGRAPREDERKGGRGDRGDRGGRNGSRSRGDREVKDRTRRPTMDSDEARGDGKPRLSRKLEVTHLP